MSSQFIAINQQLYNQCDYKRYPEAKFKFEFTNEFYSSVLNEAVKWFDNRNKYYNMLGRRSIIMYNSELFIAGGVFSEYCDNSPFAHRYPQLYDHFKTKQDIDIWITNKETQNSTEVYY